MDCERSLFGTFVHQRFTVHAGAESDRCRYAKRCGNRRYRKQCAHCRNRFALGSDLSAVLVSDITSRLFFLRERRPVRKRGRPRGSGTKPVAQRAEFDRARPHAEIGNERRARIRSRAASREGRNTSTSTPRRGYVSLDDPFGQLQQFGHRASATTGPSASGAEGRANPPGGRFGRSAV